MSSAAIVECPKCGQMLAVPSDRGTIHVNCPKCGAGWDWPMGSPAKQAVGTVGEKTSSHRKPVTRSSQQWTWIHKSIAAIIVIYSVFIIYYAITGHAFKARPIRELVPS